MAKVFFNGEEIDVVKIYYNIVYKYMGYNCVCVVLVVLYLVFNSRKYRFSQIYFIFK